MEDPHADESQSPFRGLVNKIRPQGSISLKEHQRTPPLVVVICSQTGTNTAASGLQATAGALSLNPLKLLAGVANLTRSEHFQVILEGVTVAELQPGERCRVETEQGRHDLQVTTRYGASRSIGFEVTNGQRALFACQGRSLGSVLLRKLD